jgi:hypothetical protein
MQTEMTYLSAVRTLRSVLRIIHAHQDEFSRQRAIGGYLLLRSRRFPSSYLRRVL